MARHHGRGTDGRTGWGEGSRACELEQLRNISRQLARLVGWLLKRLKPFFLPHPPSLFLFVPSSCVIYCGVLSAAAAAALAAEAFVLTTSCSTYSVVRATCAALEEGEGGGPEEGGRTHSARNSALTMQEFQIVLPPRLPTRRRRHLGLMGELQGEREYIALPKGAKKAPPCLISDKT